MKPADKIKEIEKEIEEAKEWNVGLNDWNDLSDYSCGSCECNNFSKLLELKAKLSVLKEWEAEDKRKVEELKKAIRDNKFMSVDELLLTPEDIDEIIDEIFNSPQTKPTSKKMQSEEGTLSVRDKIEDTISK